MSQDTAVPKFYLSPVENKAKSQAEGRPIFDEVEMVEIRIPGDPKTVFVDTVYRSDGEPNGGVPGFQPPPYVQRWHEQYTRFKAGLQHAQSGTPLEQWPVMSTSKVAELKAMNIFTVENLADLTDGYLGRLGMGARELREKARAFIADAKKTAVSSAIAAENAELKARLERLEGMLMSSTAATPVDPDQDKALEDCTDAELKAYIKRETGEAVRGNPGRDKLLARAYDIATQPDEAAE